MIALRHGHPNVLNDTYYKTIIMNLGGWVIEFLLYAAGAFLLVNCAYFAFFTFAGLKRFRIPATLPYTFRRMCVLIPVYKEDLVVLGSAEDALRHSYGGAFDVVVIADGLRFETIERLKMLGIKVISVSFQRSTKGKALLHAMQTLPADDYDVAMILDVDNFMDKNVLNDVNLAFQRGHMAVQAHRTSRNIPTPFAFLDACNEEINNHIYRKGPQAVGLSCALIGSGMAFEFNYLKKLLTGIGESIGEDKELDFRVAKDKIKIEYLHHSLVFDEKIENAKAFTNQRARWLSSQAAVLKKYTPQLFGEIKKANGEFINKLAQAWLLPRMLLIASLLIFLAASFMIPYGPPTIFWATLLGILFFTLLVALPRRFYKDQLFRRALWKLPYALVCMVIALFKVNKTKSSFMPTAHSPLISSKINS